MDQGHILIRSGGLGDMVLSLPSARYCGGLAEDGCIWFTARRYATWLQGLGYRTAECSIDGPEAVTLFAAAGADPDSYNSDLVSVFRGVRHAFSFLPDPNGDIESNLEMLGVDNLVTIRPPEANADRHPLPAALWFLRQMGCRLDSNEATASWHAAYPLFCPKPWLERGRRVWRKLEIQPETALVLHPGSGSTGKNLDLGHYFKLAEVVKTSTHLIPVLLMGPAEEERLGGDLPPYPTVRGLDLEGLTGFLACEPGAVLTHDSGVGHLAGALGLRVLSIFLTTDPRVWAPWFPGVTVLCCGNEVETAPVHDSSSREWKASGPRFLKYRIRSMSDCDSVNRLRVYLETEF